MSRCFLFALALVITTLPVDAQLDKRFEQQQEARRQEAMQMDKANAFCLAMAPKLSWVSIGSGWREYYNANGYHITSTGKIYSIQVENVATCTSWASLVKSQVDSFIRSKMKNWLGIKSIYLAK